jgi:hypothetical protein
MDDLKGNKIAKIREKRWFIISESKGRVFWQVGVLRSDKATKDVVQDWPKGKAAISVDEDMQKLAPRNDNAFIHMAKLNLGTNIMQ